MRESQVLESRFRTLEEASHPTTEWFCAVCPPEKCVCVWLSYRVSQTSEKV